ncbi:MAG: hypothetical protein APR63_10850 [Desulfuromonas sp. SDB]|nr:MAG: hypothetical protein APR63_10850 [Desulfuromonas sp. SDB]
MKTIESGKTRLLFLIIYIGLLFVANRIAFNSWVPTRDENSLWFGAGVLSLLLSSFLVTPYFERPANHIASAAAAFVACWLAFDWPSFKGAESFIAGAVLVYLTLVIILSACALLLRSRMEGAGLRVGTIAKEFSDQFGNDRILFSIVIISAVGLYHRDNALQVFTILSVLIFIVLLRPETHFIVFLKRISAIWKSREVSGIAGEIAGFDEPGIVLIRQPAKNSKFGDYLLINDIGTKPQLSQVLGYFGRDSGMLLRAKLLELPIHAQNTVELFAKTIPPGCAARILPDGDLKRILDEETYAQRADKLAGLVAENTSINKLYVEVIKETTVSEGAVLEASIKGTPVLYQITDGLTREEIVFHRNTRGFARAEARKIGRWDSNKGSFKLVKWIPAMHSPVFQSVGPLEEIDETAVGCLPSTKYPIRIKNIHELVTHNTAILGILGVGKSFLAIELIERMFADGVKVVCLDLTNQYAQELAPFYDSEGEAKCLEKIRLAANKDRNKVEDSKVKGGSFENLKTAIYEDLAAFLYENCESMLKIYNPAQINASIQAGDLRNKKIGPGPNDWAQVAAFRETTPAEITRMVTESCLALSQDKMRDTANVCLVFEEAHSLVPEFNNLTVDSDKHAVAGTARAILQGRKYGLGCLLISQRTANVTKTILNQCNTVLAFRTFDDTGMAFLENYLGTDYAHVLPSLEERHVVFFGKASSCENPVLMKVNDRNDFVARFRAKHPPPGNGK